MEEKEKNIMEALKNADEPLRPGAIATITNLDKDDVLKIISRLRKDGKVISPKRCFYAPAM